MTPLQSTVDQFQTELSRVGRVNGPATLLVAWYSRRIDRATLAAVIGGVWSMAEYPDKALTRSTWIEMFNAAGYTVDGTPARRPRNPLRLWRGATHPRRRLMSWTTGRAVAEKFGAGGLAGRAAGQVWTVLCPPAALLCENTDRDEHEFVIDTRGLKITLAGDAA